jgi:hypothetical protein
MRTGVHSAMFAVIVLFASQVAAQTTGGDKLPESDTASANPWAFSVFMSGYLVPDDESYASPVFTADRQWLHLEARYNYEYQKTGSLWAGYNFSAGDKVELEVTPMFGVVFGDTTGIAPGCNISITRKRVQLSAQAEYVFNMRDRSASFFYTWDELIYSPTDWFHAGLVSQRTRAYHTDLDVQRGFSVGVAHKRMDFTTYLLNAGWTSPTVVLVLSFGF